MANITQAIEKINNNDIVGLQELLKTHSVEIDSEDDHGMTLLHHASFKGKKDFVQLLLDLGSDPNGGHHEHQYSALHFGALSGNIEVCQQLLQYGVRPDTTNSVGRTAAQMAAFVGNHDIVSMINNFVSRDDIDRYTVPKNGSSEAKLPPAAAPALHKLVMQVNLHPVHLLFTIQKLPLLHEHLDKAKEVLEALCDNEMKRNREANEVLSLKFHYLRFLVERLAKEHQQHPDKPLVDLINQYAKGMLRPRASDGFPEYMDNFVREAIRTFPHRETTVFRQLLMNLSKTKQDVDAAPAISILGSCINGQRGFHDDNACAACGQEKVSSKCSNCKSVQYCGRDCQKIHWPYHKKECDKLAKHHQQQQLDDTKSQSGNEVTAAVDDSNTAK